MSALLARHIWISLKQGHGNNYSNNSTTKAPLMLCLVALVVGS